MVKEGDPIRDSGTSDQQFSPLLHPLLHPLLPPTTLTTPTTERKRLLPVQQFIVHILVRSGVMIES